MLVRFSFYDVVKIPEFSSCTVFDLLDKGMDMQVAPYLWLLGADVDKGLRIQVCKHRTLDLKTVIGYCYVCTERYDAEWKANKNFSMSARINSQTDNELASDMVRSSAEGMGEKGFRKMCEGAIGKEGTTRTVVKKDESETWEEDRSTIAALQDIQKGIRGFLHADEDIWHSKDLIEMLQAENEKAV